MSFKKSSNKQTEIVVLHNKFSFQGTHVAENCTFDGSAFSAFSISGWYWKVLARTYNEVTNEQLLCVMVEGLIVPI